MHEAIWIVRHESNESLIIGKKDEEFDFAIWLVSSQLYNGLPMKFSTARIQKGEDRIYFWKVAQYVVDDDIGITTMRYNLSIGMLLAVSFQGCDISRISIDPIKASKERRAAFEGDEGRPVHHISRGSHPILSRAGKEIDVVALAGGTRRGQEATRTTFATQIAAEKLKLFRRPDSDGRDPLGVAGCTHAIAFDFVRWVGRGNSSHVRPSNKRPPLPLAYDLPTA